MIWAVLAAAEGPATTPSFESTENRGLGKWERINVNESRLQQLAGQVNRLQTELRQLKERVAQLAEGTARTSEDGKK